MPNPLPTTIIRPHRLSAALGVEILLASETFQYTGSFKFRAAFNVASKVSASHLIAASSGNFGQALAYSCKLLGKRCHIVMPITSAKIKIEAVREYGGEVELVDIASKSRAEGVAELAKRFADAYVASAYDDELVIEGNATLGLELSKSGEPFDVLVAPVGGGGLTAGLIRGFQACGDKRPIMGAEPAMGNDAARSFREGHLVRNETEPQTLADGARTVSLGDHNWAVLKESLAGIVEVPEEAIKEAVKGLFLLANLKAEPTGALSVGAVLTSPEKFKGRNVCCVISGGNVDPDVFRALI